MSYKIPGTLRYCVGDATVPISAGNRMIMHCCNTLGGWGAGFVLAISKKWKKPEEEYRRWFSTQNNFALGEIQLIQVQSDITIANMLCQNGYSTEQKPCALDYDALAKCLDKIAIQAIDSGASIHAPRIGAGLAGGDWKIIETMIIDKLVKQSINVTIYDLLETNQEQKVVIFYPNQK